MRQIGLAAVIGGVTAQLSGLALDGWLHGRDATLAEREGVLTLTNPGHLLFAAGLALTVVGVCLAFAGPVLAAGRGRRDPVAWARASLPVAGMLLLAAGAFGVAASSGGLTGHEHAAAAAEGAHTHESATAGGAAVTDHDHGAGPVTAPAGDPSNHTHGTEVNVSWEQLQAANAMLTVARDATAKYTDVAVARADGYIQMTQVVPGLGAHFVQPVLLASGTFDIMHPPILLYDAAPDGAFTLVGVSYALPKRSSDETPPPAYFGPLAVWHYHTDLCFGARNGVPLVQVNTAAGCRAAGGLFLRQTPWMLHAWIFRPSPEGVFSHENSTITGDTPLAAGR